MHLVATDPDTDPGRGTEGLNLWALARSLGLPRACDVCAAGALSSIVWHRSIPVELLYSCGHSAIPLRRGGNPKHRK